MSLVDSLPFSNRYILFRHGEAGSNTTKKLICSPKHDGDMFGLTKLGRSNFHQSMDQFLASPQAHLLTSTSQTRIITSPLLRARQSASILQQKICNASLESDDRIAERQYGELEGEPESRWKELREHDLKHPTLSHRQAESLSAFIARIKGFLREKETSSCQTTYLIVSHSDPIQVARSLLISPSPKHYSEVAELDYGQWLLLNG